MVGAMIGNKGECSSSIRTAPHHCVHPFSPMEAEHLSLCQPHPAAEMSSFGQHVLCQMHGIVHNLRRDPTHHTELACAVTPADPNLVLAHGIMVDGWWRPVIGENVAQNITIISPRRITQALI